MGFLGFALCCDTFTFFESLALAAATLASADAADVTRNDSIISLFRTMRSSRSRSYAFTGCGVSVVVLGTAGGVSFLAAFRGVGTRFGWDFGEEQGRGFVSAEGPHTPACGSSPCISDSKKSGNPRILFSFSVVPTTGAGNGDTLFSTQEAHMETYRSMECRCRFDFRELGEASWGRGERAFFKPIAGALPK